MEKQWSTAIPNLPEFVESDPSDKDISTSVTAQTTDNVITGTIEIQTEMGLSQTPIPRSSTGPDAEHCSDFTEDKEHNSPSSLTAEVALSEVLNVVNLQLFTGNLNTASSVHDNDETIPPDALGATAASHSTLSVPSNNNSGAIPAVGINPECSITNTTTSHAIRYLTVPSESSDYFDQTASCSSVTNLVPQSNAFPRALQSDIESSYVAQLSSREAIAMETSDDVLDIQTSRQAVSEDIVDPTEFIDSSIFAETSKEDTSHSSDEAMDARDAQKAPRQQRTKRVRRTPEEKRLRRREQNKFAARRCRERKRQVKQGLIKEYQKLESSNTAIRYGIRELERQKKKLTDTLEEHMTTCTLATRISATSCQQTSASISSYLQTASRSIYRDCSKSLSSSTIVTSTLASIPSSTTSSYF